VISHGAIQMHKLVSLYIKTTKVVTLIMTRSPTTNGNWTPFILVETGTGWSSFLVFSCKRVSIAKWMMYNINLHKKVGSVSRNTPQQIVHIHIPFYQNKNLASGYVVCLMRCEMIYMRLQRKLHNGSLKVTIVLVLATTKVRQQEWVCVTQKVSDHQLHHQ